MSRAQKSGILTVVPAGIFWPGLKSGFSRIRSCRLRSWMFATSSSVSSESIGTAITSRSGTSETGSSAGSVEDAEEAEAAGMTVEGYKNFRAMEEENERLKAKEAEEEEKLFLRQHFQTLAMQAEEMKKTFPNFDLQAELQNPLFVRLTAPNSGCDVRAAYYAVHHAELEPQAMAYGIQRAQQQMSQTLQANRARPVEGAMKKGQPANVAIDPRSMTREERQKLLERARRGERIEF